ncbi:T9SS type A sorting domain-containing protein [Flavobacterium sp. UMI-01]|uniref:T9SS type A sorting domain-containing protein n=1 Tax=Flavobacterium sp. UMI-01 TaxID=1441053 RepID=UPI001C7CF222|nr:T9SS type A sorting domain-containing protein [Flavobacterium sp. UMI-01]GIZ07984.1 hypothetical protein FUMI01_07110 [Flavobacterium sp. UMI-01]
MKKITLLFLLVSAITFAQDVAPTFSWTNKDSYKLGVETNLTFTPGQTYTITQTYSLGSTAGNPNTRFFVLMALQSTPNVVTDPLAPVTWTNVATGDGSGTIYPAAGTLNAGTYTHTFTYKIPSGAALSSASPGLTYRMLFYLAYYKGGDTSMPVYGGTNASDSQIVKLRSAAEISTLGTADFSKLKLTSFYPNPVKDVITIGSDVETKTYKVLSLTGAVLKEVPATGTLNVSDLASGTYILVTDIGTAKIIKE